MTVAKYNEPYRDPMEAAVIDMLTRASLGMREQWRHESGGASV